MSIRLTSDMLEPTNHTVEATTPFSSLAHCSKMLEEILVGAILVGIYCMWYSIVRNSTRKKQNEPPGK